MTINKKLLREIEKDTLSNDFIFAKDKLHALISKVVFCDKKKVLVVQIFSSSRELLYIFYFWKNKNDFTILDIKSNNFIQRKFMNLMEYNYRATTESLFINDIAKETIIKYFRSNEDCISAINNFVDEVYSEKRNIINTKKQKAVDDELKSIKPLTKKFYKWLENEAIEESRHMVYTKKNKIIKGVCSYCKSDVVLSKARHNDLINCPSCSSKVQLKSQGLAKNLINRTVISYIESDANKNIFIRIFNVTKVLKKYDEAPKFFIYEFQRYKITPELKIKAFKNDYNNYFKEYVWSQGYYIYGFRQYNHTELGEIYTDNFEDVFRNTEFKGINLADLLSVNNVYLDDFFKRLISNKYLKYLINEKFYNLVLDKNIDKEHLEILVQNKDRYSLLKELNPTIEELMLIQFLIENKYSFNLNDFLVLNKIGIESRSHIYGEFKSILENYKDISFKKIVNYMEKINSTSDTKVQENFEYWRDYLKMSLDMNVDLTNKSTLFPKELKIEHDKITKQYEVIISEIKNKKIEKQYGELVEKYSYKDDSFSIIPPKNADEIIYEGKKLSHCVSSYIEKILNKESIVLFLRKNNAIKKPFYTIEIKNGEIRQCRSFDNKSATKSVNSFLNKWRTDILFGKKEVSLVG